MTLLVPTVLVLLGCELPASVRYRCEPDGRCAIANTRCGADGYCHPPVVDAGCVPLSEAVACATVECGVVTDGCGASLECDRWCPAPQACGVREANRCGFPSLCESSGFCWEHPLPLGSTFNDVISFDARHSWLIGDRANLLFFDGERPSLQEVFATSDVRWLDVDGTQPAALVVVGTHGAIASFDGKRWEREGAVIPLTEALVSVAVLADGGAFAATSSGRVLRRTGALDAFARWEDDAFPDAGPLSALVEHVAVTERGEVWHRASSGWRLLHVLDAGVRAAVMRDDALVVATEVGLERLSTDGGRRLLHPVLARKLVATAAGVLALGEAVTFVPVTGAPLHWETPLQWNGAGDLGRGRLLLAGKGGVTGLLRLDGGLTVTSSPPLAAGSTTSLCSNGTTAFVTSISLDAGLVSWLERLDDGRGVRWEPRSLPLQGTSALVSCFVDVDGRAWLLGNAGRGVLREEAGTSAFELGFAGRIERFWGSRAWGYFATRYAPQVVTSSTGTPPFVAVDAGATSALRAVWGTQSDVRLISQRGELLRFDGGTWQLEATVNHELFALHGVDGHFVALGPAGFVVRWGQTVSTTTVPWALRDVAVSSPSRWYGVGVDDAGFGGLWQFDDDAGATRLVSLEQPLVGVQVNGTSVSVVSEQGWVFSRPEGGPP